MKLIDKIKSALFPERERLKVENGTIQYVSVKTGFDVRDILLVNPEDMILYETNPHYGDGLFGCIKDDELYLSKKLNKRKATPTIHYC